MTNFAEKVIQFYQDIKIYERLPKGIQVMHPHLRPDSAGISADFYRKFYSDHNERTFIIGINPGRFGAGLTGVPFTDPIKLESFCGIKSDLKAKTELSADFIYEVIQQYGGVQPFYQRFYFTSISPLGFTKENINLNYYDDKELVEQTLPLMADWMEKQVSFGANRSRCICLGSGKNLVYLKKINNERQFFETIQVLDHPRFIMQYRRKMLDEYIGKYLNALRQQDNPS